MSKSTSEIAVLRRGTEGLSMDDYGDAIRSRLPDWTVDVAGTPREERELVERARVATGISISEELVRAAENLELFVVASSGCGHLPLDTLAEEGVSLANAAGIHAPGIAEQVLGNILVFSRRLHRGWRQKQRCEWRHYQADELTGSTVTVVGMGSIGETIVERLSGFDVSTIGVRYTPEKGGPTDEVIGFEDEAFHRALSRTDYLVLSSPLTSMTRGIIDSEAIKTLPPDAVLINVARGELVDTDALTHGLQTGNLRGAALDVTDPEPLPADHPLWKLQNVFITPHMGGHTPEHWPRLADILAENARALEAGESREEYRNLVNTV
jgi:phosphoglycerate dehydrogenase-like enzyme